MKNDLTALKKRKSLDPYWSWLRWFTEILVLIFLDVVEGLCFTTLLEVDQTVFLVLFGQDCLSGGDMPLPGVNSWISAQRTMLFPLIVEAYVKMQPPLWSEPSSRSILIKHAAWVINIWCITPFRFLDIFFFQSKPTLSWLRQKLLRQVYYAGSWDICIVDWSFSLQPWENNSFRPLRALLSQVGMIPVVMDQSWKHQDDFMFSLV